jgi:hypothetical protein
MKPHKHAELIKAWADGAEIQIKYNDGWCDWCIGSSPHWLDDEEYRIKPQEPKPNFYKLYLVFTNRIYSEGERFPISGFNKPNLKLYFDGETGELKSAEVLK